MSTTLPSGTVTFLFTDIEGSTQLWEQHPEAMGAALARHDALLHSAIGEHQGYIVKSTGDGLYAAFASAADGVNAAVASQRALQGEAWPMTGPLRARMALHTGEAELREDDYFGPTLNRTARLMAVGAGGQCLLSQATAAVLHDQLPPQVSLRDLGEHRLKDLIRPERVYQIVAPDLVADFPPLKSLNIYAHNLPVQLTSLVGREQEIDEVRHLLGSTRLLTLTGPGGTGKTRLALQLAAEVLSDFPDGVYAVFLAPIRDADLIVSSIAQVLGVQDVGGQPLRESVKAYLRPRQTLLVLDNFEQILAAAPFVSELLAACPRLKVVVTSREVLHLYGEQEYSTPPLALPDPKQRRAADGEYLSTLAQSPAVALFVQRGAAAKPGFALTAANAAAVAEIRIRLDGLPLALELAAAKLKLFPPQMLLARLQQRLALLTGGAHDLPARQRTLRDEIAWSYDLLAAGEQKFFRHLSVFVGGFTLEAAQALGAADELGMDFLDALAGLVDKSLVRQLEVGSGEARFWMLETIREYGLEQLAASGEEDAVRRQHAQFFMELAEALEPELKGPNRAANLARLEGELDNLRAALAWSHTDAGSTEVGLRLAGALAWYAHFANHVGEARAWLEAALARTSTPSAAHAKALWGAGVMDMAQGDGQAAVAHFEESAALWRKLRDHHGLAAPLRDLMYSSLLQGDVAAALRNGEESVLLWRAAGSQWDLGLALNILGMVHSLAGHWTEAMDLCAESLALYRAVQDAWGIATTLFGLGFVSGQQGDYTTARARLEEALASWPSQEDTWSRIETLGLLGEVVERQGELPRAGAIYRECLLLSRELGDKPRCIFLLRHLGSLAQSQRQDERAVKLIAAAARWDTASGVFATLVNPTDHERALAELRTQLGEAAFAPCWSAGQAITLDQAIDYALAA